MNLRFLPAVVAVLLLTASCSTGTSGIFASLEREQAIVSNDGLSINATVTHMAELGGRYYAAGGGSLFQRALGATKWSGSEIVAGSTHYNRVVAVGLAGTKLYAIANTGASETNKLFSSQDGSTWSEVALGYTPAEVLAPVRQTNGQTSTELVATSSSSSHQQVSLLNNVGGVIPVTLANSASGPVIAAVKTGSDYYVLNENTVEYMAGSFAAPVTVTTLPTTSLFSGLIVLSGTSMDGAYLSTSGSGTNGGSLYKGTLAGSVWTSGSTIVSPAKTSSGAAVSLGSLLYQSTSGVNSLWVGTGLGTLQEGYGYGSVSVAGTFSINPPADTSTDNYTSTKIASSQVPLLCKGSDGYYLGTVAHGLWAWDSTKKSWSQQ